jgi:hypothetical protein
VQIGDQPARGGSPLRAWDELRSAEDSRAAIDFHPEVRLSLLPETRMVVGGYVRAEAIVSLGTVRGELLPSGTAARPPLRIATPAGVVVIEGSGDAVVAVLPSGEAWVAVLDGQCDVGRGEVEGEEDERSETRLRVTEGGAVLLGRASIAEPTRGPTTFDEALGTIAALRESAEAADARALGPRLEAAVRHYDEALAWLDAEIERGAALEREQREATESGNREKARELVRELVGFTQRRMRLRAIALTRWEQVDALARSIVAREAPAPPEWETRRERAAEALGTTE